MSAVQCPVEDRLALEDLTTAYCGAVDAIGDVAGVTRLFTPDAVYDLNSLGLGRIEGIAAIGAFFESAFAGMAHNAHYASNLAVTAFAGESASITTYVHAYSLGRDGSMLDIKAKYRIDCARTGDGWKIARLGMDMLIPPA